MYLFLKYFLVTFKKSEKKIFYCNFFRATAVNEVRRLLTKALKGPLNLSQLDQLSALIKKVDSSIVASGVTHTQYPELVEFNPVIAYDVLICLMSTSQITDYFSGM